VIPQVRRWTTGLAGTRCWRTPTLPGTTVPKPTDQRRLAFARYPRVIFLVSAKASARICQLVVGAATGM
jgi:hypothetical protein